MRRLLLCAGEASGDRLAADLLKELRARGIDPEVRGIAGPRMREMGVHPIARAESITGIGLVEVARRVPEIARTLRRVGDEALRWRPDAVVTVDSPSALLRLGKRLKAGGLPVAHWVSPQVWAWRAGRVGRMAQSCDLLLCLFPMEPPLYEGTGLRAVLVGHPAVQRLAPCTAPSGPPVFGLAPGSRGAEVRAHWPVLRRVASSIRSMVPDARFVVPVARTVDRAQLTGLDCEWSDGVEDMAKRVHAAVACSGTLTLELTALGVPMVCMYRVHPITWSVGKRVVRGVQHLALPNVLAGRQVVPEHLQDLRPWRIARDAVALLGPEGEAQRGELAELRRTMTVGDPVSRAADAILQMLRG